MNEHDPGSAERTQPHQSPQSLIIDRPELAPLPSRVGWSVMTMIFWVAWGFLFLPVLTGLAWWLGIRRFDEFILWRLTGSEISRLLEQYALVILATCGTLLVWAQVEYLRFRNLNRRKTPPSATLEELAQYSGMTPGQLTVWQQARRLVVDHDQYGRLSGSEISMPQPTGSPSPAIR